MQAPPLPRPQQARNLVAATKNDRSTDFISQDAISAWMRAGGLAWNMIGRRVGDTSTKSQRQTENGLLGDYFMGDTAEAYEKANEIVSTAQTAYAKLLQEFRGAIKNDLASIAASAAKVQAETAKMATAYSNCMATLNSPGMETAIKNAERLAEALAAISQVQPNKIAFAVLSNEGGNDAQQTKK